MDELLEELRNEYQNNSNDKEKLELLNNIIQRISIYIHS